MKTLRFTYADLRLFPEDNKRRELIDGEVYVTPSPNLRHQRIVLRIASVITKHLEKHPLGEVFVAPTDVVFADDEVAIPDVLYVANERGHILGQGSIMGAPDWIIEVASPSTRQRDLTLKRKLYSKHGVTLYWIVDPEAEVVHVWQAERQHVYAASETLEVTLLPGLALKLADIFS